MAGGQQEVRERSSVEVVDGRRSVTGAGSVVPREHRKTRDSLQREQVKDKISKRDSHFPLAAQTPCYYPPVAYDGVAA